MSRRSRRALLASAAALPVVISITAPVAVAATSIATATCNKNKECNRDTDCDGCCSACNYPERNTYNRNVGLYTCFNPAYADFEAADAYRC